MDSDSEEEPGGDVKDDLDLTFASVDVQQDAEEQISEDEFPDSAVNENTVVDNDAPAVLDNDAPIVLHNNPPADADNPEPVHARNESSDDGEHGSFLLT